MITVRSKGNFDKVAQFLTTAKTDTIVKILHRYANEGVIALRDATPIDTGLTANSWYYEIEVQNGVATITFCNSHVEKDWCNIAIILQYGHGTGTGGWVEGRDYINPAIQPIFDRITKEAWKEVTKV